MSIKYVKRSKTKFILDQDNFTGIRSLMNWQQSGSLHTTCIITKDWGKEMCSPDRMIRAIELISASALAWVRALEQVYL